MNQVIKFPDLRPPKTREPIPELPPPSQYRLTSPGIIATDTFNRSTPPSRRRLLVWFGVAVLLHASLFLAIWLTPPLRLKWTPSPSDWVQVVSLPPPPSATAPVKPTGELANPGKAAAPKAKSRSTNHAAAATPATAAPTPGTAAAPSAPSQPNPSPGQLR